MPERPRLRDRFAKRFPRVTAFAHRLTGRPKRELSSEKAREREELLKEKAELEKQQAEVHKRIAEKGGKPPEQTVREGRREIPIRGGEERPAEIPVTRDRRAAEEMYARRYIHPHYPMSEAMWVRVEREVIEARRYMELIARRRLAMVRTPVYMPLRSHVALVRGYNRIVHEMLAEMHFANPLGIDFYPRYLPPMPHEYYPFHYGPRFGVRPDVLFGRSFAEHERPPHPGYNEWWRPAVQGENINFGRGGDVRPEALAAAFQGAGALGAGAGTAAEAAAPTAAAAERKLSPGEALELEREKQLQQLLKNEAAKKAHAEIQDTIENIDKLQGQIEMYKRMLIISVGFQQLARAGFVESKETTSWINRLLFPGRTQFPSLQAVRDLVHIDERLYRKQAEEARNGIRKAIAEYQAFVEGNSGTLKASLKADDCESYVPKLAAEMRKVGVMI